jgi:hypothetical protein
MSVTAGMVGVLLFLLVGAVLILFVSLILNHRGRQGDERFDAAAPPGPDVYRSERGDRRYDAAAAAGLAPVNVPVFSGPSDGGSGQGCSGGDAGSCCGGGDGGGCG